ncbi:MAG: sigma-70 family RNA polymerase sigma factor [Lachnospiraceae bacterium]
MQCWEIADCIKKAKENDEGAMNLIIERLNPLLNKYARKLFFMEREDAYQELVASLIEAVRKISQYSDDAGCINYMQRSIEHKYCYLCKQNIRKENMDKMVEQDIADSFITKDHAEKIIEREFVKSLLNDLNKREYEIMNLSVCYELSDADVAKRLGVSRQYVGKVKHQVYQKWKQKF